MERGELYQLTNEAFKQCHSVLALSRSPLAATALVTPALVLDEFAPSAEDRGRALRVVLHWAVGQLAPGPVACPIGTFRPWDDPTWRDPHWWRYNLLRHRYLEPLHPDDFVEGGRYMETLLALTGIPSVDTLYDERNRAIRAVAELLHQQMATHAADAELQRLAVQELVAPLAGQPMLQRLLAMAAIFDSVFPRVLLLALAGAEGLTEAPAAADRLVNMRLLLTGDEGANFWLSAPLREWLAAQESPARRSARHLAAARHFDRAAEPLAAVHHYQAAGKWDEAAGLLLASLERDEEGKTGNVRTLLAAFPPGRVPPARWRAIQLHLADLCATAGDGDAAIAACRAALKASNGAAPQAQCYRRLGKLYEKRNPMHALNYYRHAEERFVTGDPELVTLLKDRGWLHILRGAWPEAAQDLARALALAAAGQQSLRADIYDALASLHRNQNQLTVAIDYAQQALALREEAGDLFGVAKSLGNLGLLYARTADYEHALAAHREAMDVYTHMGNRELLATAWLNIGMTHHLAEDRPAAIAAYRACLAACREISAPLVEVRALYNLAEAHVELDDLAAARQCWHQGLELAHLHAFEDQTAHFQRLADERPALAPEAPRREGPLAQPPPPGLTHDEGAPFEAEQALALASRDGYVTPRALMEAAAVSKATATRYLAELAAQGRLVKHGQGRGTQYHLPAATALLPPALAAQLALLQEDLGPHFHLAELQMVDTFDGQEGLRLGARFTQLPDLKQFFALEAQLAAALGRPVDLVPLELT